MYIIPKSLILAFSVKYQINFIIQLAMKANKIIVNLISNKIITLSKI